MHPSLPIRDEYTLCEHTLLHAALFGHPSMFTRTEGYTCTPFISISGKLIVRNILREQLFIYYVPKNKSAVLSAVVDFRLYPFSLIYIHSPANEEAIKFKNKILKLARKAKYALDIQ
jgi:hypothetical protein